MTKQWYRFVNWFNRKAKNASIHLVKWTGKSKEHVHPKHLLNNQDHFWFVPYLTADDVVLDLGCGGAAHSLVAARKAKFVKGIDQSIQNLRIARNLTEDQKVRNVEFTEGALEKPLSEPSGAYSAVLALDILEHLYNRDQFLNEIYRVLKPQGKLFLSVPNRETTWKQKLKRYGLFYFSDLDHKHEYSNDEIKKVLEEAHFCTRHFEPTVFDTPWVGIIDLIGGVSLPLYEKLAGWKRAQGLKNPADATGFRIVAEKL